MTRTIATYLLVHLQQVRVSGQMDGDGRGNELLSLVSAQLHAVKALGVLLRDELSAVVTSTEAAQQELIIR